MFSNNFLQETPFSVDSINVPRLCTTTTTTRSLLSTLSNNKNNKNILSLFSSYYPSSPSSSSSSPLPSSSSSSSSLSYSTVGQSYNILTTMTLTRMFGGKNHSSSSSRSLDDVPINPKTQRELVMFLMQRRRMLAKNRIADVMIQVDRIHFLPKSCSDIYYDSPQPIGNQATISAPHMHAIMLDLLDDYLVEGANALDIGSGSGYISACMSRLVGKRGHVVGVDHIQELTDQSLANLKSFDSGIFQNLEIHCADGYKGWKEGAPYDAIHVGAASEEIPTELLDQLKPGGRMVIPVGPNESFHQLLVIDKQDDGKIKVKSCGDVRFVPLTTKERQLNPNSPPSLTKIHLVDDAQGGAAQKIIVRAHMVPAPDSPHFKQYEEQLNKRQQILQQQKEKFPIERSDKKK
ncbi:hypothetical protein DFA_07279 [Cavenderia fasciculata]|uniref:protein-L-isoaspartate(D-aspartate) O-methyltransferase n=1 Tax=Cavenderia fasciculata TaxID=261658 RepID=F4PVZ5_CACFS|nr:uncharacterized protein DFA_07279 [Cavenderia fasciculata]EGG20159.1 hypothetical protein DFA_07279 [Cavenderia fasciculata]|eukprot:XP_004367142.1 hypothetical protein DFA_07279 [Cavenderia fasciculata]